MITWIADSNRSTFLQRQAEKCPPPPRHCLHSIAPKKPSSCHPQTTYISHHCSHPIVRLPSDIKIARKVYGGHQPSISIPSAAHREDTLALTRRRGEVKVKEGKKVQLIFILILNSFQKAHQCWYGGEGGEGEFEWG